MFDIEIKEDGDGLLVNGHRIYLSKSSKEFVLQEHSQNPTNSAIYQFASIRKLPGLVTAIGLPDFHIGYALPIGSIAVVDLEREDASVSPDGIGFDINCGVRFLKTNLSIEDIIDRREEIADKLIQKIPYDTNNNNNKSNSDSDINIKSNDVRNDIKNGLDNKSNDSMNDKSNKNNNINKINNVNIKVIDGEVLNEMLDKGMKYFLEKGLIPAEDLQHTESFGSLEGDNSLIGQRSKHRGLTQIGTLGSGNHYLEIEVVDEIFDRAAAETIGLKKGQVVISIHTGSRGLGHGCCSEIMEQMKKGEDDKSVIRERFRKVSESDLSREEKQLEYAKIKQDLKSKSEDDSRLKIDSPLKFVKVDSNLGKRYLKMMNTASNYAWANRTLITEGVRSTLNEMFPSISVEIVSDICHNVGKIEDERFLVHRKGASRILPPGHPEIPEKYKSMGLPILVGGSMGTCSYVVAGDEGSKRTFYSTCHGAGRQVSRQKSKKIFSREEVVEKMQKMDIVFRVGDEEGMVEECGECYKDVEEVVRHSEQVGISRRVCRVKPILVIKG